MTITVLKEKKERSHKNESPRPFSYSFLWVAGVTETTVSPQFPF